MEPTPMRRVLLSVKQLLQNRREYGNASTRLPSAGQRITLWNANTMRFDRYRVVARSQKHDAFVLTRVTPDPSCRCRRCRNTFTRVDGPPGPTIALASAPDTLMTPEWVKREMLDQLARSVRMCATVANLGAE